MANDPVSYEEATEERAGEDLGDPEPEPETETDISTKSVEEVFGEVKDISQTVPDWLKPDEGFTQGDVPDIGGQRGQISIDLDASGISQMDQRGLLEVIARVNIAQLATLFDIADAVEPFKNITVSGINAIDDANTAEPVVPQSDQENIPTRILLFKASPNNDKPIYFGDDEVSPNSGFVLHPGSFNSLSIDLRGEELYMAASESGETVQLLGMV